MKKKILIIIAIIIVLFFAFNIIRNKGKSRQEPPEITLQNYPTIRGPYEKIDIIGETAKNGVGDPSIEYDNNGIGWMSYSGAEDKKVHTHLAKSLDNGKTWTFIQEINHAEDDVITLDGKQIDGGWHNEVSTLVHDPDDPGKEWKLYWHKFFSADKRILQYGWIAYKYASDPSGPWSEEIALFGAGPFPLEPYKTKIDLSELHSKLEDIIVYTELGSLYKDGTLYFTLQGHEKGGNVKIVMIASNDHGETWKYLNTLLEGKDSERFGGSYFTGSSLVEENNRFFLFVSPEVAESKGEKFQHKGTVIFEFEDIKKGSLKKDKSGNLIVHKYLEPTLPAGGLSDYDEDNTNGGILIFQIDTSVVKPGTDPLDYELFHLFNTKEKIINNE